MTVMKHIRTHWLLLCAFALWLASALASAQMVRSDSLSQDPAHAQMCAAKATVGPYPISGKAGSYQITGTPVPFKVSAYLAEQARMNGDALVVLSNGIDAWLVECYFGRLGNQPASVSNIYPDKEVFSNGQSISRWSLLTKEDTTPHPTSKPETDAAQLTYERQHLTRVIRAIQAINSASSFAARVRIFCRSQASAFPLLPYLGTAEDLEISYNELLRNEPPTREQELDRQYTLRVWRDRLSQAYENANTCQRAITTGFQAMPTDQQERDEERRARTRIAEIDRQLAPHK
jgi:hypothetical protein